MPMRRRWIPAVLFAVALSAAPRPAEDADAPTPAFIDTKAPGWKALGPDDFGKANLDDETFTWKDGVAHCTGMPVGVMPSKAPYANFELSLKWRHLKSGGNSGVFVWTIKESIDALKRNGLPQGIEVQVLDHGYAEQYEKHSGKKPDWFTTHGDVFPVGAAKMTPFEPTAPDKKRSFPRKLVTRGLNEWNHYYIRAIDGELRLWVNGEEVSGGTAIEPKSGYLCLESEGSPVEFKEIFLRELP